MKKPEASTQGHFGPTAEPAAEARGILLDRSAQAPEPVLDPADGDDHTGMAYSRLAMRLERDLSQEDRGASVLLMAADYTRVAVEASSELAWYFAEDLGRSVLLVDGSFSREGLTRHLGGGDAPGLQDILSSDEPAEDTLRAAMRRTAHPDVFFLPRGARHPGLGPPARAAAFRQFLAAACGVADFVLIQGPAVSWASRTLDFGPLVDATLLITLEGELPMGELAEAQRILSDSGAERIGLVLGAPRSRPGDKA